MTRAMWFSCPQFCRNERGTRAEELSYWIERLFLASLIEAAGLRAEYDTFPAWMSVWLFTSPLAVDGITVLEYRLVIRTKIHICYPLPISQTTITNVQRIAVYTAMNLLIYFRGGYGLEIFTLVNTKEPQHFVESQSHYAV